VEFSLGREKSFFILLKGISRFVWRTPKRHTPTRLTVMPNLTVPSVCKKVIVCEG